MEPTLRYLHAPDFLRGLGVEGPFDVIDLHRRAGLVARSVHARLTIPRHTVAGDAGTLTLWVLPLEDIAPAHRMVQFEQYEPDYLYYTLLSDHPDLRRREQARFHLRYSTDWWRNLTAQFHHDLAAGYTAIVAPDHFRFRSLRWHQIAVTWDKPASRYRLYVNGVLVGAENRFRPLPAEVAGPTLHAGNPSFALSDLAFHDRALDAPAVAEVYRRECGQADAELDAALRREYVGADLPRFAWEPTAEWRRALELSLGEPAHLARFWIQGQTDSTSITPEGLLVNTAGGDSRRDGLRQNKVEMYLWTEDVFAGDAAVEFEFKLLKTNGLALLMLHASGMQREDFMADYPRRSDGSMRMVCWENVRSYHWEFYRETDNTRNDVETHLLVKNPWMFGLAHQCRPAPLAQEVWHRLQLVQEGARLRGAIDGVQVFDVLDSPAINTGPVFNFGRLALRCKFKTRMLFRHLRVWTRPLPYERRAV